MTAIPTRKMAAALPAAPSIAATISSIRPSARTVMTVIMMTRMAAIVGVSLHSVAIVLLKIMKLAKMGMLYQEMGAAVLVSGNTAAMVSLIRLRNAIVAQANLLLDPNARGSKTPSRVGSVGLIVGFIVVTVR